MIIQTIGAALFLVAMWAALQFEGIPLTEETTDPEADPVRCPRSAAQFCQSIPRLSLECWDHRGDAPSRLSRQGEEVSPI
jgi:hypothetical protein